MEKGNISDSDYIPGTCNIGKEEVNKRKRLMALAGIGVIAFTFLCFNRADSISMKFLLFIFSSGFTLVYIQVRKKFCVSFGLAGYFNFGKPGSAEKVADKSFLIEDRKKALKILLVSLLSGLVFTLLISFLSKA